MSETSPRAEALDPRLMELAEGLRLSRRFHLFLVFVDEASTAGALAEAVERHLRASREEDVAPDVLTPYDSRWRGDPLRPEVLVESVLEPLVEGDSVGARRWLLVDATPSPTRDDSAWEALLPRLNERRNLVVRAHARPLVLALPARMEPALKRLAPDLWSIRSQTTRLERVGPMSDGGRAYRWLTVALVPIAPGVTAWQQAPDAVRAHADEAQRLLRTGAFTPALGEVRQAINACGAGQEPLGGAWQSRALVELFLLECEACIALARHAEVRRALNEVSRWRDRAAPPIGDPQRGWYLASVAERVIPLSLAAEHRDGVWGHVFVDLALSDRGEVFFLLWAIRIRLFFGTNEADETRYVVRERVSSLPRRDPRLEAALCVDLGWLALRTGRPWDAQDELTHARELLSTQARPEDAAVLDHLAGAIADALPARVAGAA